jgi:hypothetical protein
VHAVRRRHDAFGELLRLHLVRQHQRLFLISTTIDISVEMTR